jgi:predicted Zn-dependent peptidase
MSDELYTADVLSFMSGIGKSSELYKTMVIEQQIASQVGAFVDKREHCSLLTFYAVANKPEITTDEMTNLIYDEIKKMRMGKFDKLLLEKCTNQLTAQMANEIQYSHGLADMVGNFTLFWDKPDLIFDVIDKYKNVDSQTVTDFANKYLIIENSIRIDVLPKEINSDEE